MHTSTPKRRCSFSLLITCKINNTPRDQEIFSWWGKVWTKKILVKPIKFIILSSHPTTRSSCGLVVDVQCLAPSYPHHEKFSWSRGVYSVSDPILPPPREVLVVDIQWLSPSYPHHEKFSWSRGGYSNAHKHPQRRCGLNLFLSNP